MIGRKDALVRCGFSFRCPLLWRNLDATPSDHVRRCGVCDRDVHLVRTEEAFREHAAQGHCVAVPLAPESPAPGQPEGDAHMVGMPGSAYQAEDPAPDR